MYIDSVIYNYYDQNDYDFSHLVVGDEVKVSGEIGEYQGNKQIAQGATVEVTKVALPEGQEP